MSIKLSEGALEIIMTGGEVEGPIMQILGSKKIVGNSATDRFRLLISDGKHSHSFAMLATQLNQMLIDGQLSDYTVIKINRFITSILNNSGRGEKRVMIILDVTVIAPGNQLGMKIGNPQSWQEGGSSTSTSAPTVSAPKPVTPAPSSSTSNITVNSNQSTQLSSHVIHPIAGLSPYQNKWVIKARVMSKSDIRTWSNAKGEGKLFSMDLCDESGEIRATAFRDQCDKFFDMIEVDKIYYISRCALKTANKQFSSLKNDYEMTFNNDTMVEECTDVSAVPSIHYNFIPINQIADKAPDAIIDVIGVCKTASDITELVARGTGRQLKKREITLVDQSGSAVTLTLWGNGAESFDGSQQPVVAIRGARISEFNGGKSLSALSSSIIKPNPDMPEAHKLRGWFDNGGNMQETVNMSARIGGGVGGGSTDWITFSDVEEKQLGSAEKGDYYNVLGTITFVNTENAIYKACPQEGCNKKLVDQENGLYRCEKCNREFPNYKYRIILSGFVSDYSGEQWVTVFNETAETVIGRKAEELGIALENDKRLYTSMLEEITFKTFLFKIRTKLENFNDEARLKSTVLSAQPIDYKETNARLVKQIMNATGIQIN